MPEILKRNYDNNKDNNEKLSNIPWVKEIINETKIDLEKLKNMSHSDFLDIPFEKRLAFITKWNIDFLKIKLWQEKKLEFVFSFLWKFNRDLYINVTLWQVLPNEVEEIKFNKEIYKRTGLEWEFFNNKWQRLLIKDWTKIEIEKLRTKQELNKINLEIENKFNKYLSENPKYNNQEYKNIIKESIERWLTNEEIEIILTSSYEKILGLWIEPARRVLSVVKSLKNQWLLDYKEAKDNINEIKEVIDALRKYWSRNLTYKLRNENNSWENKIDFNMSSIDLEPSSLQKVIDIALSQIWITENSWAADKYFYEAGFWRLKANNVPWCAAFINWVLKRSWFKWTWSLAAKSFINGSWYWHVAIKLWDKMIWWNQWNKVSLANIPKNIEWYAIPTENWLKIFKWNIDTKNIPNWVIIVTWRNPRSRRFS